MSDKCLGTAQCCRPLKLVSKDFPVESTAAGVLLRSLQIFVRAARTDCVTLIGPGARVMAVCADDAEPGGIARPLMRIVRRP